MINDEETQDESQDNDAKQAPPAQQPEQVQPAPANPIANDGGAGDAVQPQESVLPAPKWWSFLTIGVAMIVILYATSEIAMKVATAKGKSMTNEFRLAEPSAKPDGSATANTAAAITNAVPKECKPASDAGLQPYILKQRAQLVVLGDGNLDTAIEFGSYFYANIVILAVFGLISLISLLVITKYGVSGTNGNVVAIFLLSTGIGLIYQGFFGVFQQRKNVEANMSQSISYGQLVKQIDTYCITGKVAINDPKVSLAAIAQSAEPVKAPTVNPATPATAVKQPQTGEQSPKPPPPFYVALEPADFVLYIDAKMREYQKLSILFDDKAVTSFTDSSRLTGF